MARRTLKNIDEKILKKVVKIGSVGGMDGISTITISKSLDISEPTIFVHFKTKEQLLETAFLFVTNKIFEGFTKESVALPESASYETMWDRINLFLNLCSKYTTEIMFFYNYRHSRYYSEGKYKDTTNPYKKMISEAFKDLMKKVNPEYEDLLITFCFETIFSYFIQVFSGQIKDEELSRKALFKYITTGLY
jgi:AcrR family transcriptional regulator